MSSDKINKAYSQRIKIDAIFKDCKSGGYNIEGAKANETRLNIAIPIAMIYSNNNG